MGIIRFIRSFLGTFLLLFGAYIGVAFMINGVACAAVTYGLLCFPLPFTGISFFDTPVISIISLITLTIIFSLFEGYEKYRNLTKGRVKLI